MSKVTVYTQENCVQCDATIRTMGKWGVSHDVQALQDHPGVVAWAQQEGMTTAPIVLVDDGELLVDSWAGYKRHKIKEHVPNREE